jgi:mannose-1-phosphate guanylyltransferase/mannose-6-phosphate isomerase
MTQLIIPAIMSGGAGTRLWPLSTEAHPKQFHALGGGTESLFVETVHRLSGAHDGFAFGEPIILCNAGHRDLVTRELASANTNAPAIVLEPMGRNTAAAGAMAAALGATNAPDALVLLAPADHLVKDAAAFHAAIARAAPFARERIVTFGIEPTGPATVYGYIKRGTTLGDGVYTVQSFHEKPDLARAQRYLGEGGYSWNSGMFLFSPQVLLNEFAQAADIRDATLAALGSAQRDGVFVQPDADAFARIPSKPLDIAVMEKTSRAAIAPCSIGWADIGSWDELWRLTPRDADGFAVLGPAAAADVSKMVAAGVRTAMIGGDDLVVVAAPKGLLIVPRASASDASQLRSLAKGL